MPQLPPSSFEGCYTHPASGRCYDYAVTCQVAIDGQGREQMQIRGTVSCGGKPLGFVVMGRVDPGSSFIGREESVAMDCIAVACARDAGGSDAAQRMPRRRAVESRTPA